MVEMLPGDILNEIFKINEEIKRGYDLKELFLDIVNHSTYEDSKRELLSWIDLCRESKIEEFISASNTIENCSSCILILISSSASIIYVI